MSCELWWHEPRVMNKPKNAGMLKQGKIRLDIALHVKRKEGGES